MEKCCIVNPPVVWSDILSEALRIWRSKSLAASICTLAWSSAVYHVWRLQNAKKHGSRQISEEKLLTEVSREVSRRMRGKGGF